MRIKISYQLAILLLCLFSGPSSHAQETLVFEFPEPSTTNTWFSYSVPLNEQGGWTVGDSAGRLATDAEIRTTLGRLQSLRIEMDRKAAFYLDNVSLAGLVTDTFLQYVAIGWRNGDGPFSSPGWTSGLGNPQPSIGGGNPETHFLAPARYLGNKSAAFGGNLSFDLWRNSFFLPGDSVGARVTLIPVPFPTVTIPEPPHTTNVLWKLQPRLTGFYGQASLLNGPVTEVSPVSIKTYLSVYDNQGTLVKRVVSNHIGQFRALLKPGAYTLVPSLPGEPLPPRSMRNYVAPETGRVAAPVDVNVITNQFTQVAISYL